MLLLRLKQKSHTIKLADAHAKLPEPMQRPYQQINFLAALLCIMVSFFL